MEISLVLRQLLRDWRTLNEYHETQNIVHFDILLLRMRNNERVVNPYIPDNFHRSAEEYLIRRKNINSLRRLMSNGFCVLAEEHLEQYQNIIHVKRYRFNQWQDLLTLCPPMVLIAASLSSNFDIRRKDDSGYLTDFIQNFIIPNIRCTTLPHPKIEYMENIRAEQGYGDLHVHLTNSIEVETIWEDVMRDSGLLQNVFSEDSKLSNENKPINQRRISILEQFEGLAVVNSERRFYELLDRAKALNYYLVNQYLYPRKDNTQEYPFNPEMSKTIIEKMGVVHPLKAALSEQMSDVELQFKEIECLMYVIIISLLMSDENLPDELPKAFHHYLLIKSVINCFVTHQINQKGFMQFQKLCYNNINFESDKKHKKKFIQYGGNVPTIAHIEGRFTPSESDLNKQIKSIIEEWEEYIKTTGNNRAKIKLVGHFIKEYTNSASYHGQRKAIRKLVSKIIEYKNDPDVELKNYFVGIDAASSEFNTPPEVFAPAYRELRKANIFQNFTFHVGEDFHHLLSGVRAVFEAIEFLELQTNDRIGHAAALGIDPTIWKERSGRTIYISKGEWLDNLIFICYIQQLFNLFPLRVQNKIKHDIDTYCLDIYGENFTLPELTEAWLKRRFNPLHLENNKNYESNSTFESNELESFRQQMQQDPQIEKLIKLYNNENIQKKYKDKFLLTKEKDFFVAKHLIKMQDYLLDLCVEKDIIIEVLPTSNVRIGAYFDLTEHHIWKWLEKKPELKLVIGSDDTGIFATNIYNEYAHIFCAHQKRLFKENIDIKLIKAERKSNQLISLLIENSDRYKFG